MNALTKLARSLVSDYSLVMDANRNPLSRLPPAQRFQTMIYLAIMWTTIFCAAFGVWLWYGALIVAHVIIVVGFVLTSITFSHAQRTQMVPNRPRKRFG